MMTGVPVASARPVSPPAPTTPAPIPAPTPEPPEPATPAEASDRVKFQTWHPTGPKGYWQRPLRIGEIKTYGSQSQVIVKASATALAAPRIYIENGHVFAITLGRAADFDQGKV